MIEAEDGMAEPLDLLGEKYRQYRQYRPQSPVIAVTVDRWAYTG
ncbi:MAG: hypothetical protein ACRDTC_24370 [Pseudonocardiaceae bacterium]